MPADSGAASQGGKLVGLAGVLLAVSCVAGPAVLGAVAGAAIGDGLGIAAAVVVAIGVLLVLRLRRS